MTNTFHLIIKKIINFDDNIFLNNYEKKSNVNNINIAYKIFFNLLCNNYKNKFDFIRETLDNFYLINNKKNTDQFFEYIYLIQKTYNALNRLAFMYKYNKSKIFINTDLQLNEINVNDKNVICIYHNYSKYLFKVHELLKLIYTSLTNAFLFFNEPLAIKNPYDNIPFQKSTLYNIYIHIINNCDLSVLKQDHIDLFFKFYKCHFNMTLFVINHEYILRNYSIKNYINNSTKESLKKTLIK